MVNLSPDSPAQMLSTSLSTLISLMGFSFWTVADFPFPAGGAYLEDSVACFALGAALDILCFYSLIYFNSHLKSDLNLFSVI